MRRTGARWALEVALVAATLLACSGEGKAPAVGSRADADARLPAPDFTLRDLAGDSVALRSFRGRTVVIDFWATWCAPCVFQIPILNDVYTTHREDGVVVLGVAVDAEGREVVEPFATEHEIRYPVLLGDEALAHRYGAPGFPALVIVDPEGRIDSLHVGVIVRQVLEEALERLRGSPEVAGLER